MNNLLPKFENSVLNEGKYNRVIGIDEVGRGCWAGPVYVGAYVYDKTFPVVKGVNDSKKLSLKKRESSYEVLNKHKFELEIAHPPEIDEKGITRAVEKLIQRIVDKFNDGKTYFLIDGRFLKDFGEHTSKEIKGDFRFYSIACASILAKVARDRFMNEISKDYMYYGFDSHKGYGTKKHRDALAKLGPCDLHRKSYKPIQLLLA